MSIGRDTLAYWISQAASFALSFVSSVFVAVILGPERRGVLAAVILANTLLINLSNLGLQTVSMYFIGRERDSAARLHSVIVVIVAAVALADFALVALAGEAIWRSNENLRDLDPRHLLVAVGAIPFTLYYFAAQGVMTGLGRVHDLSRFLFYYAALTNGANLAVVGLAPDGARLGALIAVWGASQVAAAVVLFVAIRRTPLRWALARPADILREARRMLAYGVRAFAGNFATGLINRVDHLFILSAVGSAGLGVYGIAAKLAELIFHPSASLENAAYRQVVATDRRESARLVQDLFRSNFWVNGLATLALLALTKPLVLLFYREAYREAIEPLRALLPGAFALSCARMLALYYSAQLGRPLVPSAIAWLTLAVNLPLMKAVVVDRGGGLLGAACVTSGCYGLMLVVYLALFASVTGLRRPADYFLPQRRDFDRLIKVWRAVTSERRV